MLFGMLYHGWSKGTKFSWLVLAGFFATGFAALHLGAADPVSAATKVRVIVWDEQQPSQKQAYENFLGNQIAAELKKNELLAVRSVCQDDAENGLSNEILDNCDVIIWWGHIRQREISREKGEQIVARIQAGKLALIALHSAHWSTPFIEAMNARAKDDALAQLSPDERLAAKLDVLPGKLNAVPKYDDALTPNVQFRKPVVGPITIRLQLPHCVFPAYRADGKPSTMRVLLPLHPIARELPAVFKNQQDEMYDEPFHVPPPDEVVLEERWEAGEWFRSGSVWHVGKGKVFYYRPGHETYPVFKDPAHLRVLENAVLWLGKPPEPKR